MVNIMSEADKLFAGSIPELYDRHLGSLLFNPYAKNMANRFAGFAGRLLETAAGTGILTRALVQSLPKGASITATDLNQPMLDRAAQRLTAPGLEWQQADALDLPFEDASFDAVVCQFGAMFFPDKPAGFAEARRVLKPDGRFVFSVWDRIGESEIPETVNSAVGAVFPDDPPTFLTRVPYAYHDTERIRRDLRDAGFGRAEIETVVLRGRAASPADPAIGLCQGSPLHHEIEARDADRVDEVTDLVTLAVAQRFGDGPIEGKLQALVITAAG
jgi:SAM-dependent methyltransferase